MPGGEIIHLSGKRIDSVLENVRVGEYVWFLRMKEKCAFCSRLKIKIDAFLGSSDSADAGFASASDSDDIDDTESLRQTLYTTYEHEKSGIDEFINRRRWPCLTMIAKASDVVPGLYVVVDLPFFESYITPDNDYTIPAYVNRLLTNPEWSHVLQSVVQTYNTGSRQAMSIPRFQPLALPELLSGKPLEATANIVMLRPSGIGGKHSTDLVADTLKFVRKLHIETEIQGRTVPQAIDIPVMSVEDEARYKALVKKQTGTVLEDDDSDDSASTSSSSSSSSSDDDSHSKKKKKTKRRPASKKDKLKKQVAHVGKQVMELQGDGEFSSLLANIYAESASMSDLKKSLASMEATLNDLKLGKETKTPEASVVKKTPKASVAKKTPKASVAKKTTARGKKKAPVAKHTKQDDMESVDDDDDDDIVSVEDDDDEDMESVKDDMESVHDDDDDDGIEEEIEAFDKKDLAKATRLLKDAEASKQEAIGHSNVTLRLKKSSAIKTRLKGAKEALKNVQTKTKQALAILERVRQTDAVEKQLASIDPMIAAASEAVQLIQARMDPDETESESE